MYNLGLCYTYGYGTEIDDKKALECFQSVENKVADAKAYVGYYLYHGWADLETDKQAAIELYKVFIG